MLPFKMATKSMVEDLRHSIPKARKSFKGSVHKKMLQVNSDNDGWGNASLPTSTTGTIAVGSMGEIGCEDGVDFEMGDATTTQSGGKEENNNHAGAIQLESDDIIYDFEDEGVLEDMDSPGTENNDQSDNARELFQKLPLQAQPHRIRKNAKTMQYECPYCSFASLYYSAVSTHTLIHTGEKPYQCHICNYRARQRGHIIIHMRIHSGKKPFKCLLCSYSTIQRTHLRVHMQVHNQDRPFQCPGCTYRSKHLSVLQMHIRKFQHNRTFACDKCDYTTARKHNLIQHMSIHTGAKPFKCSMCPYESSQKGHLNVHIRTHTGEKPYKCHQCPFASSVPKSLREHMGMHQGQRRHKCPHCSFSTMQLFSLKKHVALHDTNKTTYSCTSCNFTTPCETQYTTHMMTHSQPKPSKTANANSAVAEGDSSLPVEVDRAEEGSPISEMTTISRKPARKSNGNHKPPFKLKISIGSLVNNKKRKTLQTKYKTQPNTTNSQSSSRSISPVPQALCSPKRLSPVQSTKKKSEKAFVCLYCDTQLLSQEDWVIHEMRHFNAWPEIV